MFNKDFGKAASDFLTKDFPKQSAFEVTSKTSDLDVTAKTSLDSASSIDASVKPTIKFNDKTSLEFELSSNGVYTAKLIANNYVKNLKTSVTNECRSVVEDNGSHHHTQKVTVDTDYKYSNGTVSLKLAFPSLAVVAPKPTFGTVFVKDNVAVGVETVLALGAKPELEKATLNAQLTKDALTTAATAVYANGGFGGNLKFFYKNECCNYAADVCYSGKSKAVSASFGVGKQLADGGFGKFVFATSGEIGVSYKKELCPSTSMTVATTVDTGNLTHKTGVSLNFTL